MLPLNPALRHKLLITLAWLLAVLIIWPFMEFPVNDDWAYSKNVYNLAVRHRFVIDPWPAMNLVSQTLYGSLFVFCFGFSFTLLRFSILLLAVCASYRMYDIFFRLSGSRQVSLFTVMIFCFSPLCCALSFSFMTDIFFLSFVVFAIYRILCFAQTGKYIHYVLFVLFCLVAVLNRQQGLLLPAAAAGLVFCVKGHPVKKLLLALVPVLLCYLAHDKFRHHLVAYGIPHNIQNFSHLKTHLQQADPKLFYTQAGDLFLVLGWSLFPLVVLLLLKEKRPRLKNILLLLLAAAMVLPLVTWGWASYPLGNISHLFAIGPRNIRVPENFSWYTGPAFLVTAIKTIGALSAVLVVYFLLRPSASRNPVAARPLQAIPLYIFLLVYFAFVAVSKAYFDRYALPLAFFCLLLMLPRLSVPPRLSVYLLAPMAIIVFAFGVLETKDSFAWYRTRLQAVNYLHGKGIGPNRVDGGFEYNGWYKPAANYSSPPKSWWWVDRDDYMITAGPLQGYRVEKVFVYRRYIPFCTDSLFVLAKENASGIKQ